MCTPLTHSRRRGYQFTDANQRRPARKLSTPLSQQRGVNGLYYRLFENWPPNINVHNDWAKNGLLGNSAAWFQADPPQTLHQLNGCWRESTHCGRGRTNRGNE